jgi:predicted MFS family arabinose efflux permease
MTALLVFLLGLPRADWTALGISVVLAGGLAWWELRARNPFLDIRLLVSNVALTSTYVRNGLTLLGIYITLYGLTQWMEVAHGMSAYAAGLALIPMGVMSAVSARVVSRRRAIRGPLVAAAVLLVAAAVATFFLTSHSPVIAIIGTTALVGLMSGASNVNNQTALYREAPAEKVGTASGLLRTFGYVGSIASATITGTVFRARVDDPGLHRVAIIMVGVGLVVLLMTVFDRQLAASDRIHAR